MEKLSEFEKGKLFDIPSKWYRFQCDCLSPEDAMDIEVMGCGENNEEKYISLTLFFTGVSFWNRLKYAFQIIRGHWSWREFCVRQDDRKNLSEIFDPNKKFSELP